MIVYSKKPLYIFKKLGFIAYRAISMLYSSCEELLMTTFKKTINHLISLGGVDEISFSGGEPMLHPNIYEMVE